MKSTFENALKGLKDISHVPEQYYGQIITLAGLVYDKTVDFEMDNDLKQLSMAYESMQNSTLGKIEKIVHEIVFWTNDKPGANRRRDIPDVEELLQEYRGANINQINEMLEAIALIYSHKNQAVNENGHAHITADFGPLLAALQRLTEDLQPPERFSFNLPRIIGWIYDRGIEKGFLNKTKKIEQIHPPHLS
jgi:hypothetical protein